MARIGIHCSHEQFSPGELLGVVRHAERAGFAAAMCSDHFHPWLPEHGQSGFAWSWLGSAMQATALPFGVVNAPGQRYHPAIIAQAAATLDEMFPGRFWMALGSGQALNEHITGDPWPPKPERQARLLEAVRVIRALLAGEAVDHPARGEDGRIRVKSARLYTRPAAPIRIVGAAVSAETAEWVGGWADALITIVKPRDEMRKVVESFRRGGGEGKPMLLQAQVSHAATDAEARAAAHHQWRQSALDCSVLIELENPEDFARETRSVRPEDLDDSIRISADLARHVDWLRQDLEMGFEEIYLHQVGRDQARFVDAFADGVLPHLTNR